MKQRHLIQHLAKLNSNILSGKLKKASKCIFWLRLSQLRTQTSTLHFEAFVTQQSPDDELLPRLLLHGGKQSEFGLGRGGMERGAKERRRGDVRTSRGVHALRYEVKTEKCEEGFDAVPSLFLFGQEHGASRPGDIIAEPPRSWPGKGRRSLCTRLATSPRRSSRC